MKRFSSSIKFRQEPYFKALLRESSYVCPILIHALLNPCYAQVTILAVVLQESLERVKEEHVFKLDTYDVIFITWRMCIFYVWFEKYITEIVRLRHRIPFSLLNARLYILG